MKGLGLGLLSLAACACVPQAEPISATFGTSQNATEGVLGRGNQAVIWFDMHTLTGTIPVCDWIIVSNGEIAEIHSFYDASTLRHE